MDLQVVARSGRKFNLRRDLRWVAFECRLSSISLVNNRLIDFTQLELTWVGRPNGEKFALTCLKI